MSGDNNEPVSGGNALDASSAVRVLGVHVETIRRLARRGEIPSYKVGKDWRFSRDALQRWTETHHFRQKAPLIFIVDDKKSIRETMRMFLEAANYRVITAASGKEALDLARHEVIDMVFLDLLMPDISGVDVLRELHGIDSNLPVVIITAYPDNELMAEALRYPPVMMLPKPVDKATLLKTVNLVLKGSEGMRQ